MLGYDIRRVFSTVYLADLNLDKRSFIRLDPIQDEFDPDPTLQQCVFGGLEPGQSELQRSFTSLDPI